MGLQELADQLVVQGRQEVQVQVEVVVLREHQGRVGHQGLQVVQGQADLQVRTEPQVQVEVVVQAVVLDLQEVLVLRGLQGQVGHQVVVEVRVR